MLRHMESHVGETYYYLTLVSYAGARLNGKYNQHVYRCRCTLCGVEKDILWRNIQYGITKSCGCLKSKKAYQAKHFDCGLENPSAAEQKHTDGLEHTKYIRRARMPQAGDRVRVVVTDKWGFGKEDERRERVCVVKDVLGAWFRAEDAELPHRSYEVQRGEGWKYA